MRVRRDFFFKKKQNNARAQDSKFLQQRRADLEEYFNAVLGNTGSTGATMIEEYPPFF